jgi:hypothetical protein
VGEQSPTITNIRRNTMEIKRGTRVSLNKRARNYYFQGPNGINLRAELDETVIIPEEITDRNLEIINNSVNRGHLLIGQVQELKPEVKYKEDDKKLLEKGVKKLAPFLEEIAKTPGKGDNSPVARLDKLLDQEKNGKNRKTVIEKIEELLGLMGGISAVEEEDKQEVKFNLS